jgi:dTDP-4-amino-4,6-dideoxygalactose transaminase
MAQGLRAAGIGTQLHYIPIYHHSLYRKLGHGAADAARCPNAERYYETALSLPMYPGLTDADVERVAGDVRRLLAS